MKRRCLISDHEFEISDTHLALYERLSPVIRARGDKS